MAIEVGPAGFSIEHHKALLRLTWIPPKGLVVFLRSSTASAARVSNSCPSTMDTEDSSSAEAFHTQLTQVRPPPSS